MQSERVMSPDRKAAPRSRSRKSARTTDTAPLARRPPSEAESIETLCDALADHEVTLAEIEDAYIRAVLKKCGGRKSEAARRLDIDRTTLYRRGL